MFQKFFSNTLMSNFIKTLLSKEYIPLYDFVADGATLIAGCTYIYRGYIIKCAVTGKLQAEQVSELFPSEELFPSVTLFPDLGEQQARFYVLERYVPDEDTLYAYSYNSNVHYYDSVTHKHLGSYLRYLRGYKGLDLFPFYNCYSGYKLEDVHLTTPEMTSLVPREDLFPDEDLFPGLILESLYESTDLTYSFGKLDNYQCIAVPIRFNQTYTIALDCPTTVQLRGIIYNPNSGMVKRHRIENSYYSDALEGSYTLLPKTKFREPFLYRIETTDHELYNRQRDLYLVIQIPESNSSSIVVLEGNYTNLSNISTDESSVQKLSLYKNLSLLQTNSSDSYAFSDRLTEYLVDNVITEYDESSEDIKQVQRMLSKLDSDYARRLSNGHASLGVWDNSIKTATRRYVDKLSATNYLLDQDGYINRDIEEFFSTLGDYR